MNLRLHLQVHDPSKETNMRLMRMLNVARALMARAMTQAAHSPTAAVLALCLIFMF
ncbi:hypothetical protein [Thermomonospora cellulosilytica]|uniref:Uncharacterized protein n=1 Tax=Thermomonospora cellulosilytica TaxID=1411118 RepID=A0A7W3R7I0_9ACTN|nr:hypothetical protein [Thermomonospora cellulosilytica]MBA9002534.1 hypothetical protein [Thermomonospora cellulosilytica]